MVEVGCVAVLFDLDNSVQQRIEVAASVLAILGVRLHRLQVHPLENILALEKSLYLHSPARVGQNIQQLLHLDESVLVVVTNLGNHISERLDIFLQRLDLFKIFSVFLASRSSCNKSVKVQ